MLQKYTEKRVIGEDFWISNRGNQAIEHRPSKAILVSSIF